MRLTTLIYHDVLADDGTDDSGFSGADAASYKLLAGRFRRHLDLIGQALRGKSPMRIASCEIPSGDGHGVVLSFDDGGTSAAGSVAEQLAERKWVAHFFVPSDYIGQTGFLSATQLRQLHAAGHVVGSHSASHPQRMNRLGHAQIRAEWRDSCARIADVLGVPVVAASVPGGFYSARVGQLAAECGLQVLFTSEPSRSTYRIEGLTVIGRFAVTRRTSEAELVSLVEGRRTAALRQLLLWNTKKVAKRIGGKSWMRLRRKLFEIGGG